MTCNCRGVMHVCSEAWEFMRTHLNMTHDEMERMLAPARASQVRLRLLLGPK